MTDSMYVYGVRKTGRTSAPIWSSGLNSNWEFTKRLLKHSQPEKTYNSIVEIFCLRDLKEDGEDLQEEMATNTTRFNTARSHPVGTTTSIKDRQRSLLIRAVGILHLDRSVMAWGATTGDSHSRCACVPSWRAFSPAWALVDCREQRGYTWSDSTHICLWRCLLGSQERRACNLQPRYKCVCMCMRAYLTVCRGK